VNRLLRVTVHAQEFYAEKLARVFGRIVTPVFIEILPQRRVWQFFSQLSAIQLSVPVFFKRNRRLEILARSILFRKRTIVVSLNHLLLTIESHKLKASCMRFYVANDQLNDT
jgi:hypothetical protein